jgi:hypothetical protein
MQIARQEEHAMTDNLFDGLSSLSQKHSPHPQLEYRSIDGSGNNLSQTDLNAAGTDFTRIGPANFAETASTP